MFKLTAIITSIFILFHSVPCAKAANAFDKNYKIIIDAGYPAYAPMAYDRIDFLDKNGNSEFPISASMGSANAWAQGSQVSGFNEVPLPRKIIVRWFSVLENQFWEGEYPFPSQDFTKYGGYITVNPFVYKRDTFAWQQEFTETTSWTVNVIPGGMVVIWVTGGNSNEKYVLAKFQAKRISYGWDKFIHRLYGPIQNFTYPNRQAFIAKYKTEAEKTLKQRLPQNPANRDHFERYFDSYQWQLKLNNLYELKDFEVRTINGERYIIRSDMDQTKLKPRAIPYLLDMLLVEKKTGKLKRYCIEIGQFMEKGYKPENWEEAIAAFRKLGKERIINIEVTINPEKRTLELFLDNKEKRIELKQISAQITDLYSDALVICPQDDPSKQMDKKDFSTNPDDSTMFTLKNDDNPLSNFPYRILREDDFYYYGRTEPNGDTVRVRNLINGKRLKVNLYEDLREGCLTKEEFPKDYDTYHPYKRSQKQFPYLAN